MQHLTWERLFRGFQLATGNNHSGFLSFSNYSDPVAIDSCKFVWGCFGSCTGLVQGQIQRREEPGPEVAGPLCLGAAHTHPSGVSSELTALSTVWGALCVSLHCLLASWIGPLLQWASVCERFTKRRDRRRETLLKEKAGQVSEGVSYYSGMYESPNRIYTVTLWCIFRWLLCSALSFISTWLILKKMQIEPQKTDILLRKRSIFSCPQLNERIDSLVSARQVWSLSEEMNSLT